MLLSVIVPCYNEELFIGQALDNLAGVEVLAFAESNASAAAAVAGTPVVASHQELLSQFDPDAVVVATPDFAHRDAAVAAARAGKHLLIEKPLATSLDDAYAIRDAVAAGGAQCLVGFENRWNPHVRTAHGSIAAGEAGAHITSSATLSNTWFVPTEMLSWASQSSPAWFLMPHTIDLLIWFAQSPPVSVVAVASRGHLAARGIDTDDVVHALVTYADGTTSSVTSAWTLPSAGSSIVDFRFEFIGTTGSLAGSPIRQGLDLVTDRTRTLSPLGEPIGRALTGAPVWMAQEFALNLRDGRQTAPGVDQGVLVTEVICAIEQSVQEGRTVGLDDLRSSHR